MTTLDLEPILHSPRLPEFAAVLNERLREEAERRERFYEEMSDDQKVEFISGQVVLGEPSRNSHLIARGSLANLLHTYVEIHNLGAVRVEKCLCVFPRNDYEPDIVFFGPEKASRFYSNTMKFPVPDFAVEVLSESPSVVNEASSLKITKLTASKSIGSSTPLKAAKWLSNTSSKMARFNSV